MQSFDVKVSKLKGKSQSKTTFNRTNDDKSRLFLHLALIFLSVYFLFLRVFLVTCSQADQEKSRSDRENRKSR